MIKDFGIIASVSWNSNQWKMDPTDEDNSMSNFDYVKENKLAHESLNFAHNTLPKEKDNVFIGYSPSFSKGRFPIKKRASNIRIIFLISFDYKVKKRKLVGFYALPKLEDFNRNAKHKLYTKYHSGNISASVENILSLKNYILLDNDIIQRYTLLPPNRQLSNQSFNYINSENVFNLLKLIKEHNDTEKITIINRKLRQEYEYLGSEMPVTTNEIKTIEEFINSDIATRQQVAELENQFKDKEPEVKERISKYIERGSFADKIKIITNYKCLICEAFGNNPLSFYKRNGNNYVEVHHVIPISNLTKGVHRPGNLITVCANHHRQLHYGNAYLIKEDETKLYFEIEGKQISITRVTIK